MRPPRKLSHNPNATRKRKSFSRESGYQATPYTYLGDFDKTPPFKGDMKTTCTSLPPYQRQPSAPRTPRVSCRRHIATHLKLGATYGNEPLDPAMWGLFQDCQGGSEGCRVASVSGDNLKLFLYYPRERAAAENNLGPCEVGPRQGPEIKRGGMV
jgi:hypothetical protein